MLLCVLGEAFFAGAEIALISIDRIQLRHATKMGSKAAIRIQELLKRPEWLLGTTLVGTNLCVVVNTTLTTSLFYSLWGNKGIIFTVILLPLINWIFAEIVPKSIFQYYAHQLALRISFPLYFFSILFFPLVWLFSKAGSFLATTIGGKPSTNKPFITREELQLMMKILSDKSDIKVSERKMIDRLLSFRKLTAGDVMVPLIRIVAIDEKATVNAARKLIAQTKHRRLPVYRERIDQICGILNSFDLLGEDAEKSIYNFIRPAFFIPANMNLATLLEHLQKSGNNMAIVVDEYGGAEGIVTIEDILEEVVGEIEDEYDSVRTYFQIQHDASIVVSGQADIREINERFQLGLPEGDYETISGFLIAQMQKIPQSGDRYRTKNALITVLRATPSTVLEVKIRKLLK